MYIHLGSDITILRSSVVAVINLEAEPPSGKTVTGFLKNEDEIGRLQYTSEELPKSVVITDEGTYVTSLSAQILHKRLLSKELH
ncbi:protein of unknown function [Ruminococcaceae bacterium YRB3002]|nr:protein of unknown function [Ruminococcaceae bacterium YRB3002]